MEKEMTDENLIPTGRTKGDNSILDHLGLPFYYRHSPPASMSRGAFWLAFILVIAIVLYNVLGMRYPPGSLIQRLQLLLGSFNFYPTIRDGLTALFNQLFVIALIVSGIVAPLFATHSFCGERVSGTMEFLRLTPMSTISIVVGKMFAPAYPLHLFSAVLLALGFVFGALGGIDLGQLCFGLLMVVMGCVTLHAIGAFFAAVTMGFRGFGSILGLLIFGFILSSLPFDARKVSELSFLTYLSPWSTLDGLFWNVSKQPIFGGWSKGAQYYAIAFHILISSLFILAAAHKLDKPERPALSRRCWLLLWSFVVLTNLYVVSNFNVVNQAVYLSQFYNTLKNPSMSTTTWPIIILVFRIFVFAEGTVCLLAFLDHPHHRDTALGQACERLAGREQKLKGRFGSLSHALFATALVTATALAATMIWYQFMPANSINWELAMLVVAVATYITFVSSLALETTALRYRTPMSRIMWAIAAIAIVLTCFVIPSGHLESARGIWLQSLPLKHEELMLKKDPFYYPGVDVNHKPFYKRRWTQQQLAQRLLSWSQSAQTAQQIAELCQHYEEYITNEALQYIQQLVKSGSTPLQIATLVKQFVQPVPELTLGEVVQIAQALSYIGYTSQEIMVCVNDIAQHNYTAKQASKVVQQVIDNARTARSKYEQQIKSQIEYACLYKNFDLYTGNITSLAELKMVEDDYQSSNFAFYWHYHTMSMLVYFLVWSLLLCLTVACRRWTYRLLDKEAQKALADSVTGTVSF